MYKNTPLIYRLMILYSILSGILFWFIPWNGEILARFFLPRIMLLFFPYIIYQYQRFFNTKFKFIFFNLFPFFLISFFYSETAYINTIFFDYQDSFFFGLDQKIFGFQPALEFSKLLPQFWVSELMCFGYISFYILSFGTPLLVLRSAPEFFEKSIFILLTSFFVYYSFFILLPVAGPQYFLPFPDNEFVSSGFFGNTLKWIHWIGEGPTGAFPSSHVGIAIICLIIIKIFFKRLFILLLPLVLLLVMSTIYIKAHYFVDVAAGIISAPFLYWLSNKWFEKLEKKQV